MLHESQDVLNWELHVLSRAVNYSNLSSASPHVGLSPSQLSRLVTKLESRFQMQLLDRDTKRKSSWHANAKKLVNLYLQTTKSFHMGVSGLYADLDPEHITIGCLDGLYQQALSLGFFLYRESQTKIIEIKMMDLGDIEEAFLNTQIDLCFSSKEPGMKKLKMSRTIGYQTIANEEVKVQAENVVNDNSLLVLSPFEYHARKQKLNQNQRVVIASHLMLRKAWIEKTGGKTTIPSNIYTNRKNSGAERPVLLFAQEHFPNRLWNQIKQIKF